MSGTKKIWQITSIESNINYGVFSSKAKALDSIVAWANNGQNPYIIDTDIDNIKVMDGNPEFVYIILESGKQVSLWVSSTFINNGANLIIMGRKETDREG